MRPAASWIPEGADGVVFVPTRRKERLDANFEPWKNLRAPERTQPEFRHHPLRAAVEQRDLPNAMTVERTEKAAAEKGEPIIEGIRITAPASSKPSKNSPKWSSPNSKGRLARFPF